MDNHNTQWKPAQGNDLPEYDREVVVLRRYYGCGWFVCFAHRPNPQGYFTEDKDTGDVMRVKPKTIGKGGWNYPDVEYWLDIETPEFNEPQP